MLPTDQGLGADQAGAVDLRLVIEHELVVFYRLAQVVLHGCAGVHGGLQSRGKKANGVAARRLGLIHGNIRLLQSFVGGFAAIPDDGDADASAAATLTAVEQVRLVDGRQNLLADGFGLGRGFLWSPAQIFEQHQKLISAQASGGVGFAGAGDNALGDFVEQKVACLMAEGVVQGLEMIQIDEQQRLRAAASGAGSQGLAQPVQQQAAVGQTGQRVIEGEIADLVLGRLGMGDIPYLCDDAGDAFKLNRRRGYKRGKNLAVLSFKADLQIPALRLQAQQFDKNPPIARIRPGVEFQRRMSEDFFAFESRGIDECLIDIDIHSITETIDGDEIETGLEYGAVTGFARPQCFSSRGQARLRGLAGIDVFDQGDGVKRASLGVALRRDRYLYPGQAAVFAEVALLAGETFGLAALNSLACCLTFGPILWSRDLLEGHAGDFLQRVADDLGETCVAPQVPAVERGMDDADRGLLEGRAVALLALAELRLRQFALGDVLDNAAHLQGLALGVEVESAPSIHPALRPVCLANDAVFLVEGLSGPNNLVGEVGSHHRPVAGMDKGHPSRHTALIAFVYAEQLVQQTGTCPHSGAEIEDIASKLSNHLRFSQGVPALAEFYLRPLALGDVADDGVDQRSTVHNEGRGIGLNFPLFTGSQANAIVEDIVLPLQHALPVKDIRFG